jgi:nitroreductase
MLDLTAEELLTTTRSVRLRLDYERPVERDVLRRCVEIALQAPSGSNKVPIQFVIVTDPELRMALAEDYRERYARYQASAGYIGKVDKGDPAANAQQQRTARSADHLAATIHLAPAIVVACGLGGLDGQAPHRIVASAGSIHPGMWSFMLAARLHGLGTCWTAVSLGPGARTPSLLRIPDDVTVGALTPVAHTQGTSFKPALRPDPDSVIHWEGW